MLHLLMRFAVNHHDFYEQWLEAVSELLRNCLFAMLAEPISHIEMQLDRFSRSKLMFEHLSAQEHGLVTLLLRWILEKAIDDLLVPFVTRKNGVFEFAIAVAVRA